MLLASLRGFGLEALAGKLAREPLHLGISAPGGLAGGFEVGGEVLLVSQFTLASPAYGPAIAAIALPAILLMEVLGAVIATFAIYRAGENSRPWLPVAAPAPADSRDRTGDAYGA